MDFPTPPRGSGRHWRPDDDHPHDEPPTTWTRRRFVPADRAPVEPEQYHPAEYGAPGYEDAPTDPTMPAPLNRVPRMAVPPSGRAAPPGTRYQDLVVPRVYVEPDEQMDALRARALRWGIARDVVAILVGLYLLGSWTVGPLLRGLGFL